MCGIFGALNVKLSEEKARVCLSRIRHRGPDDEGLWQEGRSEERRVGKEC